MPGPRGCHTRAPRRVRSERLQQLPGSRPARVKASKWWKSEWYHDIHVHVWFTCTCTIYIYTHMRSLVRNFPSYGRWLWSAFTLSCQPHHHVNHIIMSTTHHQVAGTCNDSEACEFTGENTLNLCFYGYGGSWSRRSMVCVSAGAGLDVDKKCTRL